MRVPIFKELTSEQLARLVNGLTKKEYEKNQEVFKQGDVGDSFYIIDTGEVAVAIDGVEKVRLGSGSCFGERALILNEPRSATITLTSDKGACWMIDAEGFKSVVSEAMRESMMQTMQLKAQ